MPEADLQRTLKFTPELLRALQDELGWLMAGEAAVLHRIEQLAPTETRDDLKRRTSALLKGSLIVYLFALWQSHAPEDFKTWLTADEIEEFEAFEHVRDSAAHSKLGNRASFSRKRAAFERRYPFAGLNWNREDDTIDLSHSSVVLACLSFFQGLAAQLAARLCMATRPNAA
jgi:hypothetical protein